MSKEKTNKKAFFSGIAVPDAEEAQDGRVKSVFATLGVIDRDGDVIMPGAIRRQAVILEPYNHGMGLPVGKGFIDADDKEAWLDAEFFLDTPDGVATYQTFKRLEGQSEWSFTFIVEKASAGEVDGKQVRFLESLDVAGVGPVTRGAGLNTRTVYFKSAPDADAEEETEEHGEGEIGKPEMLPLEVDIIVSEAELGLL